MIIGSICARGSLAVGQTPLAKGGPDRAGRRSAPLHGHAIRTPSNSSKSCTTFAHVFLRSRQFGCASRLRGGGPDRAGRRSAPLHGRTITGRAPVGGAASIALAPIGLAANGSAGAALTGPGVQSDACARACDQHTKQFQDKLLVSLRSRQLALRPMDPTLSL